MSETQINYSSSISVCGRPLWNLKLSDDIDLFPEPTRSSNNSQTNYQDVKPDTEWKYICL